jgi:hypothetical protein
VSYDHYVLPAEFCVDAGSASRHVEEQAGRPASGVAAEVARRITARNPEADDATILSIVPLEADGDSVMVPSPFSRVEAARVVVIEEAFREGLGVFDAQSGLVFGPDGARPGVITSSREGEFRVIVPAIVRQLALGLDVDDYLIVEAADEVYIQTRRNAADDFEVERRDGSADRHFALRVATAAEVASALDLWLAGDESALSGLGWSKLDLG